MHLDGYDQRELLAGKEPGKRQEIFYFDDNGNLNAVRVRDWKATFAQPGDWLYGGPPLRWPSRGSSTCARTRSRHT